MMEPPAHLFPSKEEFLRLIAVVAIASSVALTCNFVSTYFSTTSQLPFCDTNSDSFSDHCVPCPKNGECMQGRLECAERYKKYQNSCVEDGDINDRAKKISDHVKNHLCEAYAQFLCYGTGRIWFKENDIWNDLDGHKLIENFQPDNASYIYTKRRATQILENLLEIRTNSYGNNELKCPDLVAEHYRPFSCRLRQWISNHAFVVATLCALVMGSAWLLKALQRRWYLSARGEELYERVCEVLEENALMSQKSNGESEAWVVASQLRDHLLLPKERKDLILWKKVEQLVQEDSRVDRYPKLVKGESKVVWEWQVKGSWSSASTRKAESSKLKPRESLKAI